MREIEFRGKRLDNGEWVYGYYCYFGWTGLEKNYIIPSYASACTPLQIIPETIGQYTGLKDKNGKKIFEGDIIKLPNPPPFKNFFCVVEFNDGCFDLVNKNRDFRDYLKCWTCNHAAVVVGNIYDNPELMEDKS